MGQVTYCENYCHGADGEGGGSPRIIVGVRWGLGAGVREARETYMLLVKLSGD